MVRPFRILSDAEAEAFDRVPEFDADQRKMYLQPTDSAKKLLSEKVRGDKNCAYFVLALGYFRATGRFFEDSQPRDRAFVARRHNLPPEALSDTDYHPKTRLAHRLLILELLGKHRFDEAIKQSLATEVLIFCRSQISLRDLFYHLVDILRKKSYEVPSYSILQQIISDGYNEHQGKLQDVINENLRGHDQAIIDGMFGKNPNADNPQYARYITTLLKRHHQSKRPARIKDAVRDLITLKELYAIAKPIIQKLDLNLDGIRHFARTVSRSKIFQIERRNAPDRYLHMVSFICDRYFLLQDDLVTIFIDSVVAARNAAQKQVKERYYNERKARQKNTQQLIEHTQDLRSLKQKIQEIIENDELTAEQKVDCITPLVISSITDNSDLDTINWVRNDLDKTQQNAYLHAIQEENSKILEGRIGEILIHSVFNDETYLRPLLNAILNYQAYEGSIDESAPLDFLTDNQQRVLLSSGALNIALYKIFLFEATTDAIKGGAIGLVNSYEWRLYDEYQIPLAAWKANRDALLEAAGLTHLADFKTAIKIIIEKLEAQWETTNRTIMDNKNDYVKPTTDGHFTLKKPPKQQNKEDTLTAADVYPNEAHVSLNEVLHTVHRATGCLDELQHWKHKYKKDRPDTAYFIAGNMCLGCNLGVERTAKSSRGQIKKETLETTINWYFTVQQVRSANNAIIAFIESMPLPRYLVNDPKLRTSSDGSKYTVEEDSLNASWSYKYGGNKPVISEHTFMDDLNRFFHSNVISGGAREAHYLLDGLLENDIVQSDIHSTDTHGVTEVNFGSLFFLPNVEFAPRIKGVHHHHLYAINIRSHYAKKKYQILPDHKINLDLIEPYWDELLRMHTSLLLRETTPSQLFKRFNSYSYSVNPIYDALKELGRMLKTQSILKWLDEPKYRDGTNRQLNKHEASNKLARALMVGNPEYIHGPKDDQELAESCKRLLKNAIVCWNYLYLSKRLNEEKDPEKKQELLEAFRGISVAAWRHLSFHGEFDFSIKRLEDSMGFRFDALTDPTLMDFAKMTDKKLPSTEPDEPDE